MVALELQGALADAELLQADLGQRQQLITAERLGLQPLGIDPHMGGEGGAGGA